MDKLKLSNKNKLQIENIKQKIKNKEYNLDLFIEDLEEKNYGYQLKLLKSPFGVFTTVLFLIISVLWLRVDESRLTTIGVVWGIKMAIFATFISMFCVSLGIIVRDYINDKRNKLLLDELLKFWLENSKPDIFPLFLKKLQVHSLNDEYKLMMNKYFSLIPDPYKSLACCADIELNIDEHWEKNIDNKQLENPLFLKNIILFNRITNDNTYYTFGQYIEIHKLDEKYNNIVYIKEY